MRAQHFLHLFVAQHGSDAVLGLLEGDDLRLPALDELDDLKLGLLAGDLKPATLGRLRDERLRRSQF